MRIKGNRRKPIIFGNPKEVFAVVLLYYFAGNLVFGLLESNTEYCRRRWSEFVNDRKSWEAECLKDTKMSPCCEATADHLEYRYDKYINSCPIVGKYSFMYDSEISHTNDAVLSTPSCIPLNEIRPPCSESFDSSFTTRGQMYMHLQPKRNQPRTRQWK